VFTVAIQAYIGLKIYRNWISVDNNLSQDDDLLRFLKVIPLIAAVNTLFSIITDQWLTSATQEVLILIWIEVWIGYLLGLILIIPLVLSFL
jgi:hypothetical protein